MSHQQMEIIAPFNNCSRDLVTHRELVMMRVMNRIIEKPDWNTKVCLEMSIRIFQG